MGMIWGIIRQSAGDMWEEVLYLILFNAIWLLGSLLVLPWPYLTFALFFTVYQVGQGKAINFSTFFKGAAPLWKQAYIWGGVNVLVGFILWFNMNFYGKFQTSWGVVLQLLFLGLMLLWFLWQLFTLPVYFRLEAPGFRMALRNAGILLGRYPHLGLLLAIIVLLLGLLSALFPFLAFFGAGAFTAVFANRTVASLLERELGQEQ